MPRRRRCRQLGALLPAAAAAALIAASNVPGVALAANTWTTTVTVQAVGESAVMPGGQSPSATIVQGAISVTWGPSTFQSGKEVAGYIVNRQTLGSTTVVQVCTVGGAESNVPGFAARATKRHVHRDSDGRIVAGSGLGALFTGDVARPAGITHAVGESSASVSPTATPTASPSPSDSATPSPSPTNSPTPTPTPTASPSLSPSSSSTPAPTPGSTPAPSTS